MSTATQKPDGMTIAKFAPLWSRPFDLKQMTYDINRSKGIISGYMTLFDDPLTSQPYIDTYKDVVMPGCFKRTINRLGESMRYKGEDFLLPYLWQHDPKELMGGVKHLEEDSKGVTFENRLNLRVKRAEEALALMEEGMLRGISYGYDPIQAIPQNGLRYLKEARLHEVSSVTFPAHEWAQVTDIKSLWLYDDEGVLQNIQDDHKSYHFLNFSPLLKDKKGQDFTSVWSSNKPDTLLSQLRSMLDSFSYALFENIFDDKLTDKSGAIDVVCQQFCDVLKQWLPGFLEADASQTDMTIMGDAANTTEPMNIMPGVQMGMMSSALLQSFKQCLQNAPQLKSGRVLSQETAKKLADFLAALKLTTDDLQAFVENHQQMDTAKAMADLIAEVKRRIPFSSPSPLDKNDSEKDTQKSSVQLLSTLTTEMKDWLKR